MTDRRKATGQFYTPGTVVRYIVRHTLRELPEDRRRARDLRILEPACGEGVFLSEVHRQWCESVTPTDSECHSPERVLCDSLYGLDRDPEAVARTRQALAALVAKSIGQQAQLERRLARNIRCGDALIGRDVDTGIAPFDWAREFASVFQSPGGGFDAVIGNPPYLNIRLLTRHYGEAVKKYLRERFRCATGAYDLYVLFFELAWSLLRPGGVCGMIVPNKLATLDYARECRAMLLQQTALLQIADLSQCRVFPDAGVYPYIVIWRKQTPPAGHRIGIVQVDSIEALASAVATHEVLQSDLSAQRGWHLHGSLDVEGRVPTRPLGELAEVHSGTTGFQAEQIARRLRERSAEQLDEGFEFVVTGNVDRYAVRPGDVRFMNRRFARPRLPRDAEELTERKRLLYRSPKILVAGMSQRLEAAWDPGGLALGVQLYALVPKIDANYLLAILNSKLMSYLFRLRFQAKRLAGGYLSVNKSQLAALPIRILDSAADEAEHGKQELADLAREMIRLSAPRSHSARASIDAGRIEQRQALDREIDARVYRLYALNDAEIQRVESEVSSV